MSTYADFPLVFGCPYCHHGKPLVNQISGNTFGAVFWSDMKVNAPMLTPLSPIQKCPACGKFFDLKMAGEVADMKKLFKGGFATTWDRGELSFAETKAAVEQFAADPQTSPETMLKARTLLLQAYNDRFRRTPQSKDQAEEDDSVFRENAEALLKMDSASPYLEAELLRELGRFDECLEAIKRVPESDGWFKALPFVEAAAKKGDSSLLNLSPARHRASRR